MLHTKFCGNRSTGSRKKDFWRVFTVYRCGSHFGHVTSIMSINFHFLEPESLHIKFGFHWPSGFWEKPVLSFICNWLWVKVKKWPWPSILTYLHNFMQFQVTGYKSSEKSTVFTFSYRKALVTKFDLAVKQVKVNPGSSFEQTMMGRSHQCYIPSFMEIGPPVREKKIFEGFLPYMGMAAILVMWPASCQ